MAARKSQLQSDYDQAMEDIASTRATLQAAYTPAATRGELVAAVEEALDTLSDYESESEEVDEVEEEEGDDE